jgi:predicted unusual protein kinase regulating ubiquinone biosynthesis (AarF/ABC1/UbiB family)
MFDMTLGEASLGEILRRQIELQQEYSARAVRELVLVSKQLMYFERYARELAPDYNMARDLFLVSNIFPEEVARACAARGITLPGDDVPNVRPPGRAVPPAPRRG